MAFRRCCAARCPGCRTSAASSLRAPALGAACPALPSASSAARTPHANTLFMNIGGFCKKMIQPLDWPKKEEALSIDRICATCCGTPIRGPSYATQTWGSHQGKRCQIYSLSLFLFLFYLIKTAISLSHLLPGRSSWAAERTLHCLSLTPPADQDPTGPQTTTYLRPLGDFIHTAMHCSAELTQVFLLQHLLIVFIFNWPVK